MDNNFNNGFNMPNNGNMNNGFNQPNNNFNSNDGFGMQNANMNGFGMQNANMNGFGNVQPVNDFFRYSMNNFQPDSNDNSKNNTNNAMPNGNFSNNIDLGNSTSGNQEIDLTSPSFGNNGFVDNNGFNANNGFGTNNGFGANNGFTDNNGFKDANNSFGANNGFVDNNGFGANNGFADNSTMNANNNGFVDNNGFGANNGFVDNNGFGANNGMNANNGFGVNNGFADNNAMNVNNGFVANNGMNANNGFVDNNGMNANNNGFQGTMNNDGFSPFNNSSSMNNEFIKDTKPNVSDIPSFNSTFSNDNNSDNSSFANGMNMSMVEESSSDDTVLMIPEADDEFDNSDETVALVEYNYEVVLTDKTNSSRVFSGIFEESITIGRNSTKSELTISDEKSISGLHCKINCDNGDYYITDMNSSNGTVLNGVKITEKTRIKDGDSLKLGRSQFDVILRKTEK